MRYEIFKILERCIFCFHCKNNQGIRSHMQHWLGQKGRYNDKAQRWSLAINIYNDGNWNLYRLWWWLILQVSLCRLQLGKEELPEFFEADERSCNGAEDILHLVSGISLLGIVRLKPVAALTENSKLHNASLNSVSYTRKGLAETEKESRSLASEVDLSQSRNLATPDTRHASEAVTSDHRDQAQGQSVTSDGKKGNETMEHKRKYTESASTSSVLLEMRIDDAIVGFGLQRSTVSGKH